MRKCCIQNSPEEVLSSLASIQINYISIFKKFPSYRIILSYYRPTRGTVPSRISNIKMSMWPRRSGEGGVPYGLRFRRVMLGRDGAVPASEFLKEHRGGSFQAGDGNSEQSCRGRSKSQGKQRGLAHRGKQLHKKGSADVSSVATSGAFVLA